jgi:hypothetical protein
MSRVHVRVMNFGQHWRTEGVVEAQYRLRIPLAFVASFLERTLPERVADAQAFPDDRDAFDKELALRGWPSATEIVCDPQLVAMLVDDVDFLLHVADRAATHDDFVLNTVTARRVEGDIVVLEGMCRRPMDGVKYQDV